jgi:hypothetical protein
MTRRDLILAAMAPGGAAAYTPVQVQKLMFLIDRRIPNLVGGPHFHFRPYHYGPYDRDVYIELEGLGHAGLVHVGRDGGSFRTFALTDLGQKEAARLLNDLEPKARGFVVRTSEFVRSLSFSDLVSAIYKEFPDMRTNSVFQS